MLPHGSYNQTKFVARVEHFSRPGGYYSGLVNVCGSKNKQIERLKG